MVETGTSEELRDFLKRSEEEDKKTVTEDKAKNNPSFKDIWQDVRNYRIHFNIQKCLVHIVLCLSPSGWEIYTDFDFADSLVESSKEMDQAIISEGSKKENEHAKDQLMNLVLAKLSYTFIALPGLIFLFSSAQRAPNKCCGCCCGPLNKCLGKCCAPRFPDMLQKLLRAFVFFSSF